MKKITAISFYIFLLTLLFNAESYANNAQCSSLCFAIDSIYEHSLLDKIETAELAPSLYKQSLKNNCPCLAKSMNILGFQYYNQSDIPKAKKILFEASDLLYQTDLDSEVMATNYLYIGLVYTLETDYDSAIFYFEKCRDTFQKMGQARGIADASLNIGNAYIELKQFDKAKTFLTEAYETSSEVGDQLISAYSLLNLSRAYQYTNQLEKAIEYSLMGEDIWRKLSHSKGLYYLFMQRSEIYQIQGKDEEQAICLEKALKLGEKTSINVERHALYKALAELNEQIGDTQKAKEYYQLALEQSEGLDETELKDLIFKLIDIYALENEPEQIKNIYNKLLELNDSNKYLKKIEANNRIINEKNLEDKISENAVLKATQLEKELEIRQRNYLLWLFGLACVALCLLAYISHRASQMRKRLLEQIQSKNDELSNINTKLKMSQDIIAKQNNKLEVKNQDLKNFAYVVSHDLKAPARTVKSFAKILKDGLRKYHDSELTEYLEYIEKAGANMHEMVTGLLDYSVLESEASKFQEHSVLELIEEVKINLREAILEKQVSIELSNLPQTIVGDRVRLKQVFQNLITNSIKFTDPDVKPLIKISAEEKGGKYFFHIKDNGIGIAEKNLEKVFDMFRRLNAASQYEGTGIGLSTVQKVIQQHGGEISVKSKLGEGSTFTFSICTQLKAVPTKVSAI